MKALHRLLGHALALGVLLISTEVHAQIVISDSVQSYQTLTNTTVTMTGKSELHVTGTSNPIAGSTINLNSEDAWFWLDNIRPTTADNYLGQIKVNGVTAVHGANVRVVQFGMGTVITPFTNSVQPLETFTEPGFKGASKKYSLYTYYDNADALGVMNRNITSFKLKRGFMATFATSANGSGASKVYIAQDNDVTVGNLPANLDNAVQFVRVFPWRWVSKKGSCDVDADKLDATWFYDWNNDRNSTLNWEYVPVRQQRWWPDYPTNKTSITHLSGYNEPDNSVEDSYQSLNNGDVDAAIAAWPELLACGLRVGAPAVTDGGKAWLWEFMDKANAAGLRVDYIPIHFYQCGKSAAQLKAFLQEIWDRYHKPIWVTEFNNGANWTSCGDPSYTDNAEVISSWINMMDSTPWIERYAVYSNVEGVRNMVYNEGGLTPAGVVYRDKRSPIGYIQDAYPLALKRGLVQLPLDGHTRDTSGYDNGGVSYGAPVYVAGKRGQALQFNGTDFFVKLPPAVMKSDAFTFAAWVYWDGGASNQRIFDFGNDTDQFLYLSPGSGGEMRFGLRNNSGTTTSIATSALPTGSWQHVAVTLQGTAAKIYLNGALQGQGTLPDAALSGTLLNYLGKSQWPGDPTFKGRLDEVTIVDSALTDSQVAGLVNNTLAPFAAYWAGDVDGNWGTNNAGDTNWTTESGGGIDPGLVPAENTEVKFTAGSGSAANTALDSDLPIKSLSVTGSGAVGINGTRDLTLGSGGIEISSGAGAVTLGTTGQVKLGAAQTWSNNSQNTLTVGSVVSGASDLTLIGSGKVVLSGGNTLTGMLTVAGGSSISVPSITNSLGSMSQVRLGGSGSTGTLVYTGSGEASNRSLTLNGGLGTPGAVIDQSGTGLLKITSLVPSASVAKTLTLQGSTSGTGEISSVIANGGSTTSLIKAGTGAWALSAANTYTGTTSIRGGILLVGSDTALGTGTVDFAGGAIQSMAASPRTLGNAVSISTDTTFSGAGNLLFTGNVNAGSLTKTFTISNPRTEFSGVVSGGGARIKAGAGTWVLSGANTYTGATTVAAGTLAVNGSLAAASAVTVANGGTLTGVGTIGGTVAFAAGAHLGWTLPGNSETAGKLGTGAVSVTTGATVDLVFNGPGGAVDFTQSFWTQSHVWTVLSSSAMTGTFKLGTIGTDANGQSVTGHGAFFLQQSSTGVRLFYAPAGAQPPASPSGLVVAGSPGAVSLAWTAIAGVPGYNVMRSLNPGGPYQVVVSGLGTASYVDRSVSDGTTYYYVVVAASPNGESDPSQELAGNPHQPSIIRKEDNATDLVQGQSWIGGWAPAASDIAKWSGLAGASSVSPGGNVSWNGIVVEATGGPVSIASGGTLALGTGGIDMGAAARNLTLAAPLVLGPGSQTWNVATARTLQIDGALSRSAGAMLLVDRSVNTGVVGSGGIANAGTTGITGPWAVMKSSGAAANNSSNGFTYSTNSGGSLMPFTGATAAGFNWTSTNNNSFNYDVNSTTGNIGVARVANTLRYTGAAGTQNYGSSNTGTVTLNGLMNAGTGTLTLSQAGGTSLGQVIIGANNGNELDLVAAGAGITISIPIVNSGTTAGTLAVAGANTVTLGAANTFTGGVHLGNGTLVAGNASSLGTGSFNMNGGTFGTSAVVTIGNAVSVSGTNTLAHPAQTNSFTLSGAITGSGTLKNGLVSSADASVFFTGNLGGFTGTLDYTGQSGNTTHHWRVGANSTIVDLSKAALVLHLGNVTNPNVIGKSFGFKDGITNSTLKIGALSGDGIFQSSYNNAGPNTLEVGNLNKDTTFAGIVGGGNAGTKMNLTKVGTGRLILSGSSPYSGITTVTGGTLMVNGSLTGNSPVTVGSGGTLAGTGTSSGAVTVSAGGALSPGNGSGGTLTISGALTLVDGSALNVALGSNASKVILGGGITATGLTTVNVTALGGFGGGIYPLVTDAGAMDAGNFTIGSMPAGYVYSLGASGGTLFLTVTAPPAAPIGLSASGGGASLSLAWTAAPGATGYKIKRTVTSGSGYEIIASVATTSYTDNDLADGITRYYVVTAENEAGESGNSNEVSSELPAAIARWRQTHFGSLEDSGDAANDADPDNDGMCNLLEYGLGLDPGSSNAATAPRLTSASDRLTVAFTRNTDAIDVVISVWGADDLLSDSWQELARCSGGSGFTNVIDGVPSGATISETGTGTTRSVEIGDAVLKNDPDHPKRFMRIKVEP